ncbi:MAG: hypothetical protein QG597_3878, partial [Actinomycetota bacterium]|nr:hypothetical protein [Actinomycetota bacterium]
MTAPELWSALPRTTARCPSCPDGATTTAGSLPRADPNTARWARR